MQKALQEIFSLFIKPNPPRKTKLRKSRGQSLVEVAIAFPVLIMLFAGVVEFGFIINYYLSLVDATRDTARLYSNGDPLSYNPDPVVNPRGADQFYYEAAYNVQRILDPSIDKPTYQGRRIVLDPTVDDVIVSIYSAAGSTITDLKPGGYHLFPTSGSTGNYASIFGVDAIRNTRISGAPNAGVLLIEVHYNYHHVLNLPWMTTVISNPLHLRAYTIMPLRSVEPP